ncbi:MAG: DUF5655 domain-containing protein [Patescibacteria group bacterium]|nr:DUF5655 domain-containing protein [Patescibacteria group bacterium]
MSKSWQCSRCHREFAKKNQQHSCVIYPLAKHFKDKLLAKELFGHLKKRITTAIGSVKIESLPCCIHLVSSYTFGAAWAMKDRIRIDFRVANPLKSRRFWKTLRMSANRYLYFLEIKSKKEIDRELIGWLNESYHFHDQ